MKHSTTSRLLAALMAMVMVISLMPATVFAADTAAVYQKVDVTAASDITAGTYLIYGTSKTALDDGTASAFMSTNGSTASRLKVSNLTITDGKVTTDDTTAVWKLITATGGFYIQNVSTGTYLYYGTKTGNNIYQTEDVASAGVWTVVANGEGWSLEEVASTRQLGCNRFGSAGNYYLGFAGYANTSSVNRVLEFYKLTGEEPVIPSEDPSEPVSEPDTEPDTEPVTEPSTEPSDPVDPIVPVDGDPITDDMIGEGVLTVKEASAATATGATVIGQVVYHYGSTYNGSESINSIILEDKIDGQIYGFQIYDYSNYSSYKVGDVVKVTGDIVLRSGVMQMSSPTMEVVATNITPIPAQEITVSQMGADYLSEYVYIKDVTVGTYNGTGNTTITDATGTVNLYKGAPLPAAVAETDITAVYGCCSAYNTTYQLRNGTSADYVANIVSAGDLPVEGAKVVIYNLSGKGVLASETDSQCINNALTEIVDGRAVPANGAVIFTVEKNGDYFRFHNQTYGYLCSNGTGNNAFYAAEASEDADWTVTNLGTGYQMESRTAKYNDKYSQFLEYYAESYKTYSKYNVTDYDIYTFLFYNVASEVQVTDGIVNLPTVTFSTTENAYVGLAYDFSFTVDAPFGVDGSLTVTAGENTLAANEDGTYTIPVEQITGESITITVTGKDTKGVAISGTATVTVVDEPIVSEVTPVVNSQTGDDKRPVITATVVNAGENPTIEMTINETAVETVYENGVVTYTPAEDMADGRVNVAVTITRADGKTTTKTWHFTVGKTTYQLYFGQLHSHTTYSDGSGTLDSALEYIASLPESANVDFVAFTDHSNYFDKSGAANPEAALYDMTQATAYSQEQWAAYKSTIAAFNESHPGLIAIPGFEMTWSGGPGHMNTFNTPGIVSRNNATLNNKTADAGMIAYYALLSQAEGAEGISQFNHPGSTFGTFSDFAYWDAVIDSRIHLVEVGNGEGQIGAGGYYPSYEYYTMALDKGWHVAPTNNQDNHKGKWGNANDARDVILTDNFTEEGIYEAIRSMRMYSTEDKNLQLYYTLNDQQLGSIIEEVPEQLNIQVAVYDPDSTDSISKVEVIVNSGKVAYTWDDPAELAGGELSCTLDPTYSYYYIRVTEGDGDLAVTAPVWVGETLKLGISSVECDTTTPVTGEALNISTTLFNSESTDATIKTVTYTVGSKVLGVDTTGYTLAASTNQTLTFAYTPETAKVMTITVTAVVEQDGTEYIFSMDIELDVLDSAKLVYLGIDASHYNEYVNGNYKDSMGNFTTLAAGYGVRTVTLSTSEELIAACSNPKYKAILLTAPSRRSSEAQAADPLKVYTADELAALNAFNQAGGMVILAGWSDHYENYPSVDAIANMTADQHMAATQNAVLETLGSCLRISDDATYDDSYNGGQAYRLYFSTYGDSFLTEGVEVDPEHMHDRMYTEVYSNYGGASIYATSDTLPDTVSPVVFGHSTTYSVDVDTDGLGGTTVPKYAYAEGDDRLLVMATEQLENRGLIVVAGAAFMSNFEVQATIEDSAAEKNYSNYKICENLLTYINPVTITPVSEVNAQTEVGIKYTIEGVVTSNASGYDKDTAFFDCIYVQDETGGICCFPVAGNFKIGDKVRVTGTTEFFQGEPELQVTDIKVIGEGTVAATEVTAAQINDRSVEGKLVTVKGTVESFELANGLVQTIMVKDADGNVARVFIDGYITTAADVQNLAVGSEITVTGLASYDDTFNAPDGPFPRIRIRNRADVVCSAVEEVTYTCELNAMEVSCDAEVLLRMKMIIGEDIIGDDNAYVVMTKNGKDTIFTTADLRAKGTDAKGRYILEQGIASGEMTYNITLKIYNGKGELENIYDYVSKEVSTSVTRSVLDYAERIFTLGTQEQKDLIAALITYGGYSQLFFGKDVNNPAFNLLTKQGMEIPAIEDITVDDFTQEISRTGDAIGITQTNSRVYLDSAIYMRVYFVLDAGKSIDGYTFTLTHSVNNVEKYRDLKPVYDATNNRYYVDIENIAAAYLDYMYTITVTDGTGTYTVQTSAMAWAKLALNAYTDINQINMIKAMYFYNQAANTYFGK